MKNLKSIGLSLLLSSFVISCSQVPGSSGSPDNTQSSSTNSASFDADAKIAFSTMYENENVFQDSEKIASEKSEFNTKALLDGAIGVDIGADIKTKIANLGASLDAKTELTTNLLSTLGRANFVIKTSGVVSTNNSDGSTTKTVSVDFTGKTSGKTRNDTVAKTYFTNNTNKIEHYLTVDFGNYNRIATRTSTMSGSQQNVETKSTAKLSNGTTIVVNETRKADVNNGVQATGSGTVTITKSDGTSKNYNFNSNVSATGQLMVNAKDTAKNTEIMIEEKTKGMATATVKAEGSTQATQELNTEVASETYAAVN